MLKDLKEREVGFLGSYQSRYMEYGRACRDILQMCKEYAGPKVSEPILIAEMAEKYALQEKNMYKLTKNEKHRIHIKIASEYYLKDFATFNELLKSLSKYNRILNFEESKILLKENAPALYYKTKTSTLQEVLKFIEINKKGTDNENDNNDSE